MVASALSGQPLYEVRVLRYVREPFYEFHPRGRKTIRYEQKPEFEPVGEVRIVDLVALRQIERSHDSETFVVESKRHYA